MITDEKYLHSTELLFKSINITTIIESCFTTNPKAKPQANYKMLDKGIFSHKFIEKYKQYTLDEVEAFYEYYFKDRERKPYFKCKEDIYGVFEKINNIASEMLEANNANPKVKFENILRWNLVTKKLGENLFISSYYALEDIKSGKIRNNFSWSPIIDTNNNVLNSMFEKNGLAENHFHLKGSSYIFICNWIFLMNHIKDRKADFEYMGIDRLSLSKENYFNTQDKLLPFYQLTKIAFVIRSYLFMKYCLNDESGIDKIVNELSEGINKDSLLNSYYLNRLVDKVDSNVTFIRDFSKGFGKNNCEKIDYAISNKIFKCDENEMAIFFGERYFMYEIFKQIYSKENMSEKDKNLFYLYNCIKTKFHAELVQPKELEGFKNFANYQNRKTSFIQENSIYEKCLFRLAVNTTIDSQNVTQLETRIAPDSIEEDIKKADDYVKRSFSYDSNDLIKNPDNSTENDYSDKYFYTIHCIKGPEGIGILKGWRGISRNHKVRKKAKETTLKLMKIRKSSLDIKERVRGIDTCNYEIGTRPEVFAQMYRVLDNHNLHHEISNIRLRDYKEIEKLGRTYHVGEDFTDLLDGLRAIDEVIYFLEFRNGDRLGHALALGYNCEAWYRKKKNYVTLRKQDILDNLCWLYEKVIQFNIEISVKASKDIELKTLELIKELYRDCFKECFKEDISIERKIALYCKSIKLRGDNPYCYEGDCHDAEDKFIEKGKYLTPWNECQLKEDRELDKIRNEKVICNLYYYYHFNMHTVSEGSKYETYLYTDEIISIIGKVQRELQKEIASKRIAIECNPTSNYLIGNMNKFEEHPITSFYNKHLTYDAEQLNNNPQINVSINTDDQGVFNTSLRTEYAILALSLSKMTDENGKRIYNDSNIYDWLESIRVNGFDQSFM